MLELAIANKNYSSWSLRPWVLMHELAIPFDEQLSPFSEKHEPQSVFAGSPSRKVPYLKDGDVLVWDSLAIAEYLAEIKPEVWPSSREARAWARSAAAEMHSGFPVMRDFCTMNCGLLIETGPWPEGLKSEVSRLDALWQQGLSHFGGPFLAGDSFTAVDAFYAPVAFRVRTYGLSLSPESMAYAERLLALSSMRAWYDAALQEPWRDEAHEEEARRAGRWIEDNRVSS
ncbi:glutathione S-transferase family protein [Marinobacter sp. BGYM27]|uniref:glutathione S-transferase family protein n=1 Tax=Marinobacter sp. BGYM27 TaxID=2975597 RepID=UPI0021A8E4C2|nr:glutathione S-transferase family protein [Marinobacter sp. BGYM27]MDG5499558.1 glutathione S-transferase family protein [Marinobacter sp. BGYM27]